MSIKGVSGSERKRTCIGYELITDPKVLLLDEPTSGLDSITSNLIIRILRKEAARGLTVISTIHLPSSETFHLFDRLCLMHDGY
jgi:ABC-type multidrug transport system ATPase subunit